MPPKATVPAAANGTMSVLTPGEGYGLTVASNSSGSSTTLVVAAGFVTTPVLVAAAVTLWFLSLDVLGA